MSQSTVAQADLFTILVNYNRSVVDGVTAGKYDYVCAMITDKNFPPTETETGIREIQFTLQNLNQWTLSERALSRMAEDGKRPATLRELLAFGEAHPELHRQFHIVALGSVFAHDTNSWIPSLDRRGTERRLHLNNGTGWGRRCRFLAVAV